MDAREADPDLTDGLAGTGLGHPEFGQDGARNGNRTRELPCRLIHRFLNSAAFRFEVSPIGNQRFEHRSLRLPLPLAKGQHLFERKLKRLHRLAFLEH